MCQRHAEPGLPGSSRFRQPARRAAAPRWPTAVAFDAPPHPLTKAKHVTRSLSHCARAGCQLSAQGLPGRSLSDPFTSPQSPQKCEYERVGVRHKEIKCLVLGIVGCSLEKSPACVPIMPCLGAQSVWWWVSREGGGGGVSAGPRGPGREKGEGRRGSTGEPSMHKATSVGTWSTLHTK